MFEVQSTPRMVTHNMPMQLGFFVLQYAKLRVLQFFYDFIKVNVNKEDYQVMTMDTDSVGLAFSTKTLRDAVKPEMRDSFDSQVFGSCTNGSDSPSHATPFVSRECCEPCRRWDSRVCGLFKVENTGDEMIALCSKSHFLKYEGGHKMALAGIMKNRFEHAHEKFLSVLNDQQTVYSDNIGIRAVNSRLYTYQQHRAALNFMYTKRVILEDFVSTKPLDITLTPGTLLQCAMCDTFSGHFMTAPGGLAFCNDCVQFMEHCGIP